MTTLNQINFKSPKVIAIILAVLLVPVTIVTAFNPPKSTDSKPSQSALSTVTQSVNTNSNSSSLSSLITTTSSTSSSNSSSSSSSEQAKEELSKKIPVTVTPEIPQNIDANQLGFIKSFANTVDTSPATTKVENNSQMPDFTQADVDYLMAETQIIVNKLIDLDLDNLEETQKLENPKLTDLSRRITTYQSQNPEMFEKLFPGSKQKMDDALSLAFESLKPKFMKRFEKYEEEQRLKVKAQIAKCKQNTTGYVFNSITESYNSVNAKVVLFDRSKGGFENAINNLIKNCGSGNYNFFDTSTVDFDKDYYTFPKFEYNEDYTKRILSEDTKHYLGHANIYGDKNYYSTYFPDKLVDYGFEPITQNPNINTIIVNK